MRRRADRRGQYADCPHGGQRRGDAAAGQRIAEPQDRAGGVANERTESGFDVAVRPAAGGDTAAAFRKADGDRADRDAQITNASGAHGPRQAASAAGTGKIPAPTMMLMMLAASATGPTARTSPTSRRCSAAGRPSLGRAAPSLRSLDQRSGSSMPAVASQRATNASRYFTARGLPKAPPPRLT